MEANLFPALPHQRIADRLMVRLPWCYGRCYPGHFLASVVECVIKQNSAYQEQGNTNEDFRCPVLYVMPATLWGYLHITFKTHPTITRAARTPRVITNPFLNPLLMESLASDQDRSG